MTAFAQYEKPTTNPPIIEITHASQYDLVPAKDHPLRGVQTDPRVAPRDQYALLLPGVVEVDVGGGVVIAAVEIDVVLGGKVDATKVRLRL